MNTIFCSQYFVGDIDWRYFAWWYFFRTPLLLAWFTVPSCSPTLPVVAVVRAPVRRCTEPDVRTVLDESDSPEQVHDVPGERREQWDRVPVAPGPHGELSVRRPIHARSTRENDLLPALLLYECVELFWSHHHHSLISRYLKYILSL